MRDIQSDIRNYSTILITHDLTEIVFCGNIHIIYIIMYINHYDVIDSPKYSYYSITGGATSAAVVALW